MRRFPLALVLSAALVSGSTQALGAPVRAPRAPAPPPAPVFRPPAPPPAVRAPSAGALRAGGSSASPALTRPVDQSVHRVTPGSPGDPVVPARATLEGGEVGVQQPMRLSDPVAPPAPPQHPLAPAANSPEAQARVRVTIRAIAARRAGEVLELDGRLRPIEGDLRSFAEQFNYKLYQLLDEQTLELDFTKPTQMELPGQRVIQVQATGPLDEGRLRLHLELLGPNPQRARKLHTDYSLPKGRTILVGGYQVDPDKAGSGTLLLAITQAE